ncbi:MAG: DUF4384 domain-containing protein [candidate division KSB1 bacterium]|nr:DUF4384 domain-containing protein [candidate division KSB1 bacterium]MDZ7304228.1 DUF4384 domain-containing protein [candidate division KSB1 bacterium]MDZ7311703.1 DUF4384 domain-containing protein [candidate division KSB1 bacterium]
MQTHHTHSQRGHFAFLSLLFFVVFPSVPVLAHDTFGIDLKVWSSQSFDDPFYNDEPIEIYFRVNQISYLTVYQIDPWGGVEIIYPRPYHRWLPVHPWRTYRLTDLAPELALFYDGAEGRAYIGLIATRHPINIVPWLEAGFRDCGFVFGRPSRTFEPGGLVVGFNFGVMIDRVLADVRLRLGSACVPTYYVTPIYVRPRIVMHRPPHRAWRSLRKDFEPPPHKPRPPQKAFQPKWGADHEYSPSPPQPEPEKSRSFRRRGFEPTEPTTKPESRPPFEPAQTQSGTRSDVGKRAIKESDAARVKNDSGNSSRSEPSRAQDRRVKKYRN